jgi:hypothetical protein
VILATAGRLKVDAHPVFPTEEKARVIVVTELA